MSDHLEKKYKYEQSIYLSSATKQCCPNGQYFKDTHCVDIPRENCLYGGETSCTLCKDGY